MMVDLEVLSWFPALSPVVEPGEEHPEVARSALLVRPQASSIRAWWSASEHPPSMASSTMSGCARMRRGHSWRCLPSVIRRSLSLIRFGGIFPKGNTMATMADSKARRTRRSFTDAYKTGAVRLVLDEGKTVAAAARDLGLTESSLRNWVAGPGGSDQGQGANDRGAHRASRVAQRQSLRCAWSATLKKAAAFFARNQA